jgi:hypothetical protein
MGVNLCVQAGELELLLHPLHLFSAPRKGPINCSIRQSVQLLAVGAQSLAATKLLNVGVSQRHRGWFFIPSTPSSTTTIGMTGSHP